MHVGYGSNWNHPLDTSQHKSLIVNSNVSCSLRKTPEESRDSKGRASSAANAILQGGKSEIPSATGSDEKFSLREVEGSASIEDSYQESNEIADFNDIESVDDDPTTKGEVDRVEERVTPNKEGKVWFHPTCSLQTLHNVLELHSTASSLPVTKERRSKCPTLKIMHGRHARRGLL